MPDGRISNVGKDCGKKLGERWREMRADFAVRTKESARRVSLESVRKAAVAALSLEHHVPEISIREATRMLHSFDGLPARVRNMLERMAVEKNGALFAMRPPSDVEIARAIARNKDPQPVRDHVGVLEGLAGILPTNRLDTVLQQLEARRGALERILKNETAKADEISTVLEQLKRAVLEPAKSIDALRRFFTPSNIARLRHLQFGRTWPYRQARLADDFSITLIEENH